jgi:acid phosphatase
MKTLSLSLAAAAAIAACQAATAPTFSTIQPSPAQISAVAATAPVANYKNIKYVPGKAFNRIYNIWLENQDFDVVAGVQAMQELAKEGILLTNYFALTHPSEPNYLASAAGDYFGLGGDQMIQIPANISSIVDLLESKGISWAEYQEDLPYAGYQGFQYLNQKTGANDYVRKHDPLILFESVTNSPTRLSNIKNFTSFYDDLNAEALPQWSFITPNMTNDGHDTNAQVAGTWSYDFLYSLLTKNDYFTKDTLIILTFDENASYAKQNIAYTLLLGDIPDHLKGTTDDTFYDHYSLISTVEANWELPNLGRYDCGANVFDIVAKETHYKNPKKFDFSNVYNNQSIPGYLSDETMQFPAPNCKCQGAGGPVLQSIVDVWGKVSSDSTSDGYVPKSNQVTGGYCSANGGLSGVSAAA